MTCDRCGGKAEGTVLVLDKPVDRAGAIAAKKAGIPVRRLLADGLTYTTKMTPRCGTCIHRLWNEEHT